MKQFLLLTTILLLISCNKPEGMTRSPESAPAAGAEVQSSSGQFTVHLPPEFPTPEADTQRIETPAGDTISMYSYISEMPRGVCIFGSNEYSFTTFKNQDPDDMLENARDAAVKQWNAKLTTSNFFNDGKKRGISFYFITKMDEKDYFGRFDYVISKPRMYQVGFLSHDKSEILKPEIQKYFGSLLVPAAM